MRGTAPSHFRKAAQEARRAAFRGFGHPDARKFLKRLLNAFKGGLRRDQGATSRRDCRPRYAEPMIETERVGQMLELATAVSSLTVLGMVLGMVLAMLWLAAGFGRAVVGVFCLLGALPVLHGLRAILTWVQDRRAMRE